jgi:hypothetical protein
VSVGYRGNIEVLSGRTVRGWCADLNGNSCLVSVHVDGEHKMSIPAIKPRRDLQDRGFCKDGGGFAFDLSSVIGLEEHEVEIRDPSGGVLPGGAKKIVRSDTVFGCTSVHVPRGKNFKIGAYGSYYLATDPRAGSVLGKILTVLGTTNIKESDGTEHCNIWHHYPHHPKPQGVPRFINCNCTDISKSAIDRTHHHIFGRSVCVEVSEISEDGMYVVKSEDNATHDGKVYRGLDVKHIDLEGSVLQRLIDNRINDEYVYDIRVPVIGDTIPFVYIKTRSVRTRFSNANETATITSVNNYLSPREVEQIIAFCREVGLDCGELDVLRDESSRQVFVVDVNNTPSGPPNGLSQAEMNFAIREMAWAFSREFLSPGTYWDRNGR